MKSADNSFDQNILMLRILVGVAWVLAVVLASPQAVIWRVLKHPHRLPEFYQVGRCQVRSFLFFLLHRILIFFKVDIFDYNFIVHTDVQMRAVGNIICIKTFEGRPQYPMNDHCI